MLYKVLPYWWGIKFGGLLVLCNRQIKIRKYFTLTYIRMAMPYQTAKLKSVNTVAIAILGSTSSFTVYFDKLTLFAPRSILNNMPAFRVGASNMRLKKAKPKQSSSIMHHYYCKSVTESRALPQHQVS